MSRLDCSQIALEALCSWHQGHDPNDPPSWITYLKCWSLDPVFPRIFFRTPAYLRLFEVWSFQSLVRTLAIAFKAYGYEPQGVDKAVLHVTRRKSESIQNVWQVTVLQLKDYKLTVECTVRPGYQIEQNRTNLSSNSIERNRTKSNN